MVFEILHSSTRINQLFRLNVFDMPFGRKPLVSKKTSCFKQPVFLLTSGKKSGIIECTLSKNVSKHSPCGAIDYLYQSSCH